MLTFNEKLSVVYRLYDETYISKRICFDKKSEQMLGLHKCAQTIVVRGNILDCLV